MCVNRIFLFQFVQCALGVWSRGRVSRRRARWMDQRACILCGVVQPREGFGAYQWDHNGPLAKCWRCLRGLGPPPRSSATDPAVKVSTAGVKTVANTAPPIEQGASRWLARGEYADTRRPCVVKWNRTPARTFYDEGTPFNVADRSGFDVTLKILRRALWLVERWNAVSGSGVHLDVIVPEVMRLQADDNRRRYCWQTQRGGPTPKSNLDGHLGPP